MKEESKSFLAFIDEACPDEEMEKIFLGHRENAKQGNPKDLMFFLPKLVKELEKYGFHTKALGLRGVHQPKLIVGKDDLEKGGEGKLLILCSNKGKNIGFSLDIDLEERLKKFSKDVYIIVKRWPPIEGKSYFLISYLEAKDHFIIFGTRQALYDYNKLKNAVITSKLTEEEFLKDLANFIKKSLSA